MSGQNTLFISAIRVPATAQFAVTAYRDLYRLHQLVYGAFPSKQAAAAARVLFRFDFEGEHGYLYVQSAVKPDWSKFAEKLGENLRHPVPLVIPEGDRLRFRLLAKPSVRIAGKSEPDRGKRRTLRRPQECIAWLDRQGAAHGFRVERCRITERIWYDSRSNDKLSNRNPRPLHAVQFDGVLIVEDREKLCQAVRNGIGPQKAYGFGLLSLAPLLE